MRDKRRRIEFLRQCLRHHWELASMPNFRRVRIPGGTFFFTLVTSGRRPVFASDEMVAHLRSALRRVALQRPFRVAAIVVLPDHLHCIWRLPPGDGDYSSRWREIKKVVTRSAASQGTDRGSRQLWQRRFWEHAIRDAHDGQQHVEYIHYNPVRHGYVKQPADWPWSSFGHFVARRWYDADWGSAEPEAIRGVDLEQGGARVATSGAGQNAPSGKDDDRQMRFAYLPYGCLPCSCPQGSASGGRGRGACGQRLRRSWTCRVRAAPAAVVEDGT